jgi:hypothetical protein
MPRDDKSSSSNKQKRKACHIEQGYSAGKAVATRKRRAASRERATSR